MSTMHTDRAVHPLLVGRSSSRTRGALLLAVGLFAVTATLRSVAPGSALHDCCHEFVFGVLAPFVLSGGGLVSLPFVNAAVTIAALAAIHAALNEGYLPGLLLAMAPSYGLYTSNGPGPARSGRRNCCCPSC